jgi:hypothetical protein
MRWGPGSPRGVEGRVARPDRQRWRGGEDLAGGEDHEQQVERSGRDQSADQQRCEQGGDPAGAVGGANPQWRVAGSVEVGVNGTMSVKPPSWQQDSRHPDATSISVPGRGTNHSSGCVP